MKPKVLIGSAMAVALMGVGVLAGSVAGTGSIAAQTAVATPSATPSTPSTTPSVPAAPSDGLLPGKGRGGSHGRGGGDFGLGLGRGGEGATAENAARQITNTTTIINFIKADLAYATGKMDTASVQRWLTGADSLLQSAQSANSSSQFGQSLAYAQAARELALTAQAQMAQELGAAQLPSYSQLPQHGEKGIPDGTTLTQAQASRLLSETYNRLIGQAVQSQGSANASQAATYVTEAQNAYKVAYDAYQAGNYTDAVQSARLAGRLSRVAGGIVNAATAPNNADTPVTVPAPNF